MFYYSIFSLCVFIHLSEQLLQKEIVCPGIQTNINVNLTAYYSCTVIEGDVYFMGIMLSEEVTLPNLKEITGSLVLYYVSKLRSLESLLPRLTVIRGRSLVYRYAMIVKETELQEIGLTSLREIEVGDVLIESNPSLCHVKSVNWNSIVTSKTARVQIRNTRKICFDTCPHRCQSRHCWNSFSCQEVCHSKCLACRMDQPQTCCHPSCIGGCYGDGDASCIACQRIRHKGRCLASCPNEFAEVESRRCVSNQACSQMFYLNENSMTRDNYSIEAGQCVRECSNGLERNRDGICVTCGKSCSKKVCGQILIQSVKDLRSVQDCYSVKDLYISIKEKDKFLHQLLNSAFSNLRIVENAVKIIRAPSLNSLDFLSSIEKINGGHFTNGSPQSKSNTAALEVYDNENLVSIFSQNSSHEIIAIPSGHVSFILNRKLCPRFILEFLQNNVRISSKLSDTDLKLINTSNGDLAFCKGNTLKLDIKTMLTDKIHIRCSSPSKGSSMDREPVVFKLKSTNFIICGGSKMGLLHNKRVLYEIDVVEIFPTTEFATDALVISMKQNISKNELYNNCENEEWLTVEGQMNIMVYMPKLKPATRYAVFAEVFRSQLDDWLEMSDFVYFTTRPTYPTPPTSLQTEVINHSEIKLSWTPPHRPNGIVTHYNIFFKELQISKDDFISDEVCYQKSILRQSVAESPQSPVDTPERGSSSVPAAASRPTEAIASSNCDCDQCRMRCQGRKIPQSEQYDLHVLLLDHLITLMFKKNQPIHEENSSIHDLGFPEPYLKEENRLMVEKTTATSSKGPTTQWNKIDHNDVDLISTDVIDSNIVAVSPSPRSEVTMKTIRLLANTSFFVFTGLKHYTEYFFEIEACQSPDELDIRESEIHNRKMCSYRSSISSHTRPKASVDSINSTEIQVKLSQSFISIQWKEPEDPNGMIIYFLLRYRLVATNDTFWFTECVSRSSWLKSAALGAFSNNGSNVTQLSDIQYGSLQLTRLQPGLYEFQIQPVSLVGNGSWTELLEFYVQNDTFFGTIEFGYVAMGFIVFLIISALIVFRFYQFRRKRSLAKKGCVSSNPNYWIIYDIDEWEIQRKNIDMIDWNFPLGRGSFGMVYKGILRKVTTPASQHFVIDPKLHGVYIAVKTLNAQCSIMERREFINEACYMKQFQSYHLVKLIGVVSKIDPVPRRMQSSHNLQQLKGKFAFLQKWKKFINDVFFECASKVHHRFSPLTQKPSGETVDSLLKNASIASHFQKMPLVLMELMDNGDLTNFLRKIGEEGEGCVSESQSHLWALQIADGMLYLSDRKFVHRDLAARNCMINANLIVKIGDFGMARDIYYDCYYRKQGRTRLPVRWMSPEALITFYFTSASDVWSYGVVLWEISTMASLPYRGMSHYDVIQFVSNGGTLLSGNVTVKTTNLLLDIMKGCWLFDAEARLTFQDIVTSLLSYADDNFRCFSHSTTTSQSSQGQLCIQTEESEISESILMQPTH